MVELEGYRATLGEGNFIKQINAPIFWEAVLAINISSSEITTITVISENNKF